MLELLIMLEISLITVIYKRIGKVPSSDWWISGLTPREHTNLFLSPFVGLISIP
jgi:hypothetical protein